MRTMILGFIVMSGVIIAAEPTTVPMPIPPRQITTQGSETRIPLAQEIAVIHKESGIPLTVAPELATVPVLPQAFDRVPFWSALDHIASATKTRWLIADRGKQIRLVKHTGPVIPVSVDGPFRVAVRQIESRRDFETGGQSTLVTLDIHWEPRFPVIRLDGEPSQITAEDDQQSTITASSSSAKVAPLGYQHTTTIRLSGIPRSATRLTQLTGSFTVTAAPGVLPFTFVDLLKPGTGSLPSTVDAGGVSARLVRFEKLGDQWEAEVSAAYPPSHPEFESFESWTANNRAQLVSADGTKRLSPMDFEINEVGRTATGIYRFRAVDLPQSPAGWKLMYETPAALREYPVRFTLRDLPLP